ncbi:MAG: hypothetical protein JXA11_04355 [Phycisphaerae bacterium]|nr:hypothetical protein [Phycisphaerae bacterium]
MAVHDNLIYDGNYLLYDPNTDELIYGDNCNCCELDCDEAEYFCRYLHCSCYDVASYRCCIKGDIDHPQISNYDPGWLLENIGEGEWQYSGPGADGSTPIIVNLKITDFNTSTQAATFRLLVSMNGGEPFLNRTYVRSPSGTCINCTVGPFDTLPQIYVDPPGYWMPDYTKCNDDNGVPCRAYCKPTHDNSNWIATVTLSGIDFWGWNDGDAVKFLLCNPLAGSYHSPWILDWDAGAINGTHVLTKYSCCEFRKEFPITFSTRDYWDWWNDPEADRSDFCPNRYLTDRTMTNEATVRISFIIGSDYSRLTVTVSSLRGFGMKYNWDGYGGCSGEWRMGSFAIFYGEDEETSPSCEDDLNVSMDNDYTAWASLGGTDSNYWRAGKNGSATVQLSGL